MNQLLEIKKTFAARQFEQPNSFVLGIWLQDAIKNRTNQQHSPGIEEPDQRHQRHGRENLPPVRQYVVQQAGNGTMRTRLRRSSRTLRVRHYRGCHAW